MQEGLVACKVWGWVKRSEKRGKILSHSTRRFNALWYFLQIQIWQYDAIWHNYIRDHDFLSCPRPNICPSLQHQTPWLQDVACRFGFACMQQHLNIAFRQKNICNFSNDSKWATCKKDANRPTRTIISVTSAAAANIWHVLHRRPAVNPCFSCHTPSFSGCGWSLFKVQGLCSILGLWAVFHCISWSAAGITINHCVGCSAMDIDHGMSHGCRSHHQASNVNKTTRDSPPPLQRLQSRWWCHLRQRESCSIEMFSTFLSLWQRKEAKQTYCF